MGYNSEYPMQAIAYWKGIIPFNEYDEALNFYDMLDKDDNSTGDIGKAKFARTLTSPYGALEYGIGDEDYCIVFDYGVLPNGMVALHSVVNCESGGFIQNCDYKIVVLDEAEEMARWMVDSGYDTLAENDLVNDAEGWADTGEKFVKDVANTVKKIKESVK
jgi:hypothetical protein